MFIKRWQILTKYHGDYQKVYVFNKYQGKTSVSDKKVYIP